MQNKNQGVDIIIPVYNGYDDIILCMDSIRKNTDLTRHRVVFVNDCSPDNRIMPLLSSFIDDAVLVIDSEVNEGFSASVNKGMRLSEDRDVLLLNSDTIVTPGWIEKIIRCAYSKPEIGSVTPLSNAATLCSYPNFCQDNRIPLDTTLERLSQAIEQCSFQHYPQITVAVGFCMYIKREVINQIGYFDAETFQRGYGEENDFCNRLQQIGYIDVMCDDAFVYHKGTGSFDTNEKFRLMKEHTGILEERYPDQMRRNHLYCMANPEQYIRDNIEIYHKLNNGKRNILYVSHLDFRPEADNHIGGTQLHIRDLKDGLCHDNNIIVAARDRDCLNVVIYVNDEEFKFRFYIGTVDKYTYFHNERLARVFANILDCFEIDLVHVHHTRTLSLDIFYEAAERNIPIIATVHDYYMACPAVILVDNNGDYCNCCLDTAKCDECLQGHKIVASTVNYISKWRAEHTKVLSMCEKLIFPADATRDNFLKFYPELGVETHVINHGLTIEFENYSFDNILDEDFIVHFDTLMNDASNPCMISGWLHKDGIDAMNAIFYLEIEDADGHITYIKMDRVLRYDVMESQAGDDHNYLYSGFKTFAPIKYLDGRVVKCRVIIEYDGRYFRQRNFETVSATMVQSDDAKLKIAFVGGLTVEKGSRYACELIKRFSDDSVLWYIYGMIGDRELGELDQYNLIRRGVYSRENLGDMLAADGIDAIMILSKCPETFCFTLSEAWQSGIPVIGLNNGAVGERIIKSQTGWVFDEKNIVEDISRLINQLLDDKNPLIEEKSKVDKMHLRSAAEMVDIYNAEIYAGYSKLDIERNGGSYEEIFRAYSKCDDVCFENRNLDDRINYYLEKQKGVVQNVAIAPADHYRKLVEQFESVLFYVRNKQNENDEGDRSLTKKIYHKLLGK
ncbi:MAG: glycosyltransferase [Lachnospiraceae bacterium]|nr:glycosyltransferase [Lachnospiraceae bacterium]